MKFVALISGGKDSCYNLMTCIAEGHEAVALANLRPENKDELDSYMYQTVGHHAIHLYADALDLPLYVATIKGSSLSIGRDYLPQQGDEVEDLFLLLSKIKKEKDIEAVSVGAILSDYQRVRVENVCQRLGLKVLAFLWRRNQEELLREMIASDLKAIIIKVAAMGLLPDKHLGMELKEILPHMIKMREKYGLNECGEGGEYETFVFDCPLFKKSIVIEEKELVIHSDDSFAPVGYFNLKKCHLQEKPGHDVATFVKNVETLPLTTTAKWMATHVACGENCSVGEGDKALSDSPSAVSFCEEDNESHPVLATDGVNFQVAGLKATVDTASDITAATESAMNCLKEKIEGLGHQISDLTSVSLYVKDMANYSLINAAYIRCFGINPPVRICIQVCLPPKVLFQLDCQGRKSVELNYENDRKTMHVQSLSHWAPANIGPFSQALQTGGRLLVSGTIALVPSNLALVDSGAAVQGRLALTHVVNVLEAMGSGCTLAHCPIVNCYITSKENIPLARKAFDSLLKECRQQLSISESEYLKPAVQCCVVPALPRGATVEWQLYAWVFSDTDQEDIHCNQHIKKFSFYTVELNCKWFQQHLSFRIEARSLTEDLASIDIKQLGIDMMREYNQLMDSHSGVFEKSLTKIFFPADRFSEKELRDNFQQNLPPGEDIRMPVISFIPVISLETERQLLVWCQ